MPVGCHLADQLLLPLLSLSTLGEYGRFRTMPYSMHTQTNLDVLDRILNDFGYSSFKLVNGGIEFAACMEGYSYPTGLQVSDDVGAEIKE